VSTLGQLAVTLSAGGTWGWLAYATAAALAVCGLCVLLHGLAVAWRERGGGAPGPPQGSPVTVPVDYEPGVPEDVDLEPWEKQEFAAIAWRLENGTRQRTAVRRRGPVRRTRQRTGKR